MLNTLSISLPNFQEAFVFNAFVIGLILIALGFIFLAIIVPLLNICWGFFSKIIKQPSYVIPLDANKFSLPLVLAGGLILFLISIYLLLASLVVLLKVGLV